MKFAAVICKLLGHSKPNSTVAAFTDGGTFNWQCPRCDKNCTKPV